VFSSVDQVQMHRMEETRRQLVGRSTNGFSISSCMPLAGEIVITDVPRATSSPSLRSLPLSRYVSVGSGNRE
jgi:hypothetical protein